MTMNYFGGEQYELKAPKDFWKMLENNPEKLDEIENGCGPRWMIGKTDVGALIVPDTMWGLSVTKAGIIHDFMYHFGKSSKDKEIADQLFLKNLYTIIDDERNSKWLRFLRHKRAGTYYNAVSKMGADSFGRNADAKKGFSEEITKGTI